MTTKNSEVNKDLVAQREYEAKMKQQNFDFGLTVSDAFIRGIRDIGYKSTATALYELVDNPIQADATNVHVVFGYTGKSDAKPTALAILDDGHGMDPTMMRIAVSWGGTHREGNRDGMGRYGYGLPSASVSQGKAFSVYSRTADNGPFHKVTIDVTDIGKGVYTQPDGRVTVPEPVEADLPAWVKTYAKEHFGGERPPLRTVVVIDRLDRLDWKTTSALERNLLESFGVTYRNYLRSTSVFVDGKGVEPVDPLFLTPGARYYDLDEERAEALEPLSFDVKDPDSRELIGTVKVRFCYMPSTFQRKDKASERGAKNKRFPIIKDNNGIIVLRQGRQIDVVTKCPWTTFTINDRNLGIEVDYPATLDEEFNITTSKQQISISDRMWELLAQHGVWNAIKAMRKRNVEDRAKLQTQLRLDKEAKRASELAMERAERFKTREAAETTERTKKKAEALEQEVSRRSRESGVEPETIRKRLVAETTARPFRVEERSNPGGPFYSIEQRGSQKVLIINTAHRFFTDVYAADDATPRLQSALEVVLFVIGDSELDASGDRELFYKTERAHWSMHLETVLARLDDIVPAVEEPSEDDTESVTEAEPVAVS